MLNYLNDILLFGTDQSGEVSPWVLVPTALLLAAVVLRRQAQHNTR
jgi:hypothetical protein